MQNGNFKGYPSDNCTESKKRPSWGTVVLTGFVCFLVGALSCGLVFVATGIASFSSPAVYEPAVSDVESTPIPTIIPSATSAPAPTQQAEIPSPTQEPQPVVGQSIWSFEDVYDSVAPSVVYISTGVYSYSEVTQRNNEEFTSSGSGIVLSPDGYIITNEHVVSDAEVIKVTYMGADYNATVVGSDATVDIAVIKIDGVSNLIPAPMGDSDSLRVGSSVIAIGNPLSTLSNTVTSGIVSGVNREVNTDGKVMYLIQTDAAINPGNSGGPLVNSEGKVVGVCNMKTVIAGFDEYGEVIYSEGIGYAIPINTAMSVAEQIIANGYVPRPAIGIQGYEVTQFISEETLIPQGVCVTEVMHGGPCDVAGILPDDVIVGVEGVTITTFAELSDKIKSLNIGDKLTLKVWRLGEEFQTDIVIGDMNSINKAHDAYVAENPETTVAPWG